MASRARTMLKVLFLGDTGAGKTCLLNQYVSREFSSDYKVTIGSDFTSKQVEIDGKFVTLQIWDTAGQERFQSLGSTFFRGTDCLILVYDVTNAKSFENINKWKNDFVRQLELKQDSNFPFLLLGNKCDIQNKVVQASAAREYAQMNGMIFHEVSAKTAEGVQTAFEEIVRKALENTHTDEFVLPQSVINIEKKQEEKNKSCC
ncbi:small GTP-binding protein, putative [Trichomonas vaginalis G3]|uniref:Ras-related protein Rab-7b n=2 Tax=Trichomonas vaginalis TaxID=5722 RepID=A0A8U0WPB1_TRIV3|nr:small Rab GTPase Rab7c [Trichomonas vaginalis G3]AAX97455.1 small Rab GTPase Rab7c [Trichomonas vaginalis]EAX92687.1 small GTP-binding protein, putative [Trichomonas vaginalis G3]KAI5553000.1 small Rab GTPase Rab7c [Trichomonas vaginalis G3]|eukprot:XP_001305617.1 small GTP-binding protein [Trichomonas vaginalis G3]